MCRKKLNAEKKCKSQQTLVLLTNPTGARKEMKAVELDAINYWKGKMHVTKLLLKRNMKKTYFCIFE